MTGVTNHIKVQEVENNVLELLIHLHRICEKCYLEDPDIGVSKTYISNYLSKSSVDKMNYFEDVLYRLQNDYNKLQTTDYSEITKDVLALINAHYKEELSLDQAAKRVCVTPQYLSKIFKDETGKTFKETIIDKRMTEAKRLIQDMNLNIRQIAYALGYNDPNYFIRLFKKNTGLTPKEYQRVTK